MKRKSENMYNHALSSLFSINLLKTNLQQCKARAGH